MNITPAELQAHPLMAKVAADIAETRAKQAQDKLADEIEAQRIRGEQGRLALARYEQALQEYERLRAQTHSALGTLWTAVQDFSRLKYDPRQPATIGSHPPGFAEQVFLRIDLPSLVPNASPWAAMSTGFSTTHSAVAGWAATGGKTWG